MHWPVGQGVVYYISQVAMNINTANLSFLCSLAVWFEMQLILLLVQLDFGFPEWKWNCTNQLCFQQKYKNSIFWILRSQNLVYVLHVAEIDVSVPTWYLILSSETSGVCTWQWGLWAIKSRLNKKTIIIRFQQCVDIAIPKWTFEPLKIYIWPNAWRKEHFSTRMSNDRMCSN